MSAHLALGAIGALAGLAALGSQRRGGSNEDDDREMPSRPSPVRTLIDQGDVRGAADLLTKAGRLAQEQRPTGLRIPFPVATLWRFNRKAMWSSGLTPEDLVKGKGDQILRQILHEQSEDPSGGTFFSEAAEYDISSFNYWIHQFSPYVDREGDVPSRWAIEVADERHADRGYIIEDGLHRMAAAHALKMHRMPAVVR